MIWWIIAGVLYSSLAAFFAGYFVTLLSDSRAWWRGLLWPVTVPFFEGFVLGGRVADRLEKDGIDEPSDLVG